MRKLQITSVLCLVWSSRGWVGMRQPGSVLPGPLLIYCSQNSNASRYKPSPPPSDGPRKCIGSTSQEFSGDLQKKMRQSPRNLNSEVKSLPPSYYLFNDKDMPLKKSSLCMLTFGKTWVRQQLYVEYWKIIEGSFPSPSLLSPRDSFKKSRSFILSFRHMFQPWAPVRALSEHSHL